MTINDVLGNTVGETIAKARSIKKLSQQKVANFLDVSRPAIANYERDANKPTYDNVVKLSDILNIPEQYFFDSAYKSIERITTDEIKSNPTKYSNSIMSSQPKDIQELINNYQILSEEDRNYFLIEIIEKAKENL